jgi:hypothetical protein
VVAALLVAALLVASLLVAALLVASAVAGLRCSSAVRSWARPR